VVFATLDFHIVVFWFVTPCYIFVDGYKYFEGICLFPPPLGLKYNPRGIITKITKILSRVWSVIIERVWHGKVVPVLN
jgi:hypothetical protein